MTEELTTEDWENIRRAVELVTNRVGNRIDNDKWKVYRAGTIVRVDINNHKENSNA